MGNGSPPIRFETSAWTRVMGEHEILGITRPRTDTKEGLLICVPRNGQGQLQIRKPTESEVAHAALQCATSSDGGNVQIQGPALFGTLTKDEEVLPTQAKTDGVLLDGDITRSPAFDTWNATTSDMRWHSAKHDGLGYNKTDAKNCIYAFVNNDDELHGVEYDARMHSTFDVMAFLSNANSGSGSG